MRKCANKHKLYCHTQQRKQVKMTKNHVQSHQNHSFYYVRIFKAIIMAICIQYFNPGSLYFQIQVKNSKFSVDLLSLVTFFKSQKSIFHKRICFSCKTNPLINEKCGLIYLYSRRQCCTYITMLQLEDTSYRSAYKQRTQGLGTKVLIRYHDNTQIHFKSLMPYKEPFYTHNTLSVNCFGGFACT